MQMRCSAPIVLSITALRCTIAPRLINVDDLLVMPDAIDRQLGPGMEAFWRGAGVQRGDFLLLHSDIRRLMKSHRHVPPRKFVNIVLQGLLEALGPEGTLLLPLFNYGFTHGQPFDIAETPSEMGILTETARRIPGVVRSGHPVYSFAALGAHRERFSGLENHSGYGPDSPFGVLLEAGGRIAVLDVPDQKSMTFYHFVEEALNTDYRYHKKFVGDYKGAFGEATQREFSIFVRDLDRGITTSVSRMEALLWSEGLYKGAKPGEGSGLRIIDAAAMFSRTAQIIESGRAIDYLYEISPIGSPNFGL